MKIIEIIKEEQKQINEALPLLTIPFALSAIMAFFKAKSVYDIYNFIVTAGKNPESLTEEDYIDLAFDIILLIMPGGGAATREVLKRVTPNFVKKFAASQVQKQIAPLKSQLRAELRKANALPGKMAQSAARDAARAKYKLAAEKIAKNKLTGKIGTIAGLLTTTPMFVSYWSEISMLEDELKKVKNGEDTETYGPGATYEQALAEFERIKRVERGKLVVAVTGALTGVAIGKRVEAFRNFIPFINKKQGGAGLIAALTPAAIPLFMQSELGKKFLANATVEMVLEGIGGITTGTLSLISEFLKSMTGIGKSDTAQQPAQQPASPVKLNPQFNVPPIMRVYPDQKNPKKINIGGIQFTDDQGYLIANQGDVDRVKSAARISKLPDPTANMQRKPALQ